MADAGQRELERRAAQGDEEAAARLLLQQVRRGEFPGERLELLARAGDPTAARAAGLEPPATAEAEAPEFTAFRERLASAIVWAHEQRGPPAAALRSLELVSADVAPYSVPIPSRITSVDAIAAQRASALAPWPTPRAHRLAGGRLLLFDVDGTLSDGVAELATDGLFDVYNAPPWDTAVHYAVDGLQPGFWRGYRSYLVAYVPPRLVGQAERGVDVVPDGSLRWASDHDGPFTQLLKSAGLA